MHQELLGVFYTLNNSVFTKPYEVDKIMTPTSEMKKLRQIEAKQRICACPSQRWGFR